MLRLNYLSHQGYFVQQALILAYHPQKVPRVGEDHYPQQLMMLLEVQALDSDLRRPRTLGFQLQEHFGHAFPPSSVSSQPGFVSVGRWKPLDRLVQPQAWRLGQTNLKLSLVCLCDF
jgi:hypothetical protein